MSLQLLLRSLNIETSCFVSFCVVKSKELKCTLVLPVCVHLFRHTLMTVAAFSGLFFTRVTESFKCYFDT